MARVISSFLEGVSGSIGELVIYKVGGKTYIRKKPGKQSKATKAKTSERNRHSQSVNTQTHRFLKNITPILRFGYQNYEDGARKAYHAAVSYTMKNSFKFEANAASKVLDISLVKVSRGNLLGPQEPKVERVPEGVKFSWEDNSWQASASPNDPVFVFLLAIDGILSCSVWEFFENIREKGSHILPVSNFTFDKKWHAWIAFSQANPWTKKRELSDLVYLGIV